jgi:alkylhydroperoxidase family enzyme
VSRSPSMPSATDIQPGEQEAFERVVARQNSYDYKSFAETMPHPVPSWTSGEIQPYFRALLHSPLIADHISELGVVYRTRGESGDSYAHADREWVDMVVSQDLDCPFVQYVHLFDAVAVGVRPEAVRALRAGRLDELTPRERQLTDYIRAVMTGTVTDEQYGELEQRLGARGTIELTGFIGHLLMTIRIMQAVGGSEWPQEHVDELIDGLIDGSIALPDSHARVPSLQAPTPSA